MLKYGFFIKHLKQNKNLFSLKKVDSDYNPNEVVLNALVGTLVKYGSSGRVEPYLASHFYTSSNGLTWEFFLRSDITDENNEPITSKKFVEKLKKQLLSYSQESSVMDFEYLVGWQEYKSNKQDLKGLQYTDTSIIFQFSRKPEDLLEFLRMPYFGYWVNDNDTDNTIDSFKSSGAYQLIRNQSSTQTIQIELRKNWPHTTSNAPNTIRFNFVDQELLNDEIVDVVQFTGLNTPIYLSHYIRIDGPPTVLFSMILSPNKDGPFKNIQNRRAFLLRFQELQKTTTHIKSTSFYLSAINNIPTPPNISFRADVRGHTFHFAFPSRNYNQHIKNEIMSLTKTILEAEQAHVKFEEKDPLEDNWRQRLLSNREFDARMNGVDIGGHPQNLALKMIFCSTLGVSFPDPSNRMCSLVKSQDVKGGPLDNIYIDQMNQILYEDASVIPLTHSGTSWLLNHRKIDTLSFPATVVSPLFEKIVLL